MKLRNKKTGEIINNNGINFAEGNYKTYNSLAELNEEWEDAPEEPFSTSFYTIVDGKIKHCVFYKERVAGCPDDAWAYIKDDGRECIKQLKEVGLYFETKEEAELTVRKLKAWKRLKDKGFRFTLTPGVGSLDITPGKFQIEINADMPAKWFCCDAVQKDLDDCFGGEE